MKNELKDGNAADSSTTAQVPTSASLAQKTNVSGSVCNYCKGKGKIFHWEFGQFIQCGICQTDR